jgi:hypothetical protein
MMLLVDTKVDVKYKDGGVIMEKIPKAVFTEEFKEEAVKMVTEGGLSISKATLKAINPQINLSLLKHRFSQSYSI